MNKKVALVLMCMLSMCFIFGCGSEDKNDEDKKVQSTKEPIKNNADSIVPSGKPEEGNTDSSIVSIVDMGYTNYQEILHTDISIDLSYQIPFVNSSSLRFSNLSKTFENEIEAKKKRNGEIKKELLDFVKNPEGTDEIDFLYDNMDLSFMRSDTNAVSILYTHKAYKGGVIDILEYLGMNYDTKTGKVLKFNDVVTDAPKFFELVHEKLKVEYADIYGDMFEISKVIEELSKNPQIEWIMTSEGITVYFNAYDIAPVDYGHQAITIYYDERPELFNEIYTKTAKDYIIPLTSGETYAIDTDKDGVRSELVIDEIDGEDGFFKYDISLGDKKLTVSNYSYSSENSLVYSGGKYYLYLTQSVDGDGQVVSVVDLQDMGYIKERNILGYLKWNETGFSENEDGSYYVERSIPFVNPNKFYVSRQMDLLGTYYAAKQSHIDEKGYVESDSDRYEADSNYAIKIRRDFEVDVVDYSGKVIGEATLVEGTYFDIVFTDNKSYVDVVEVEESNIENIGVEGYALYNINENEKIDETTVLFRIKVETYDYPRLIAGQPEDEMLEGMMYAG